MSYEQKPNEGVLFKNDRKETDTQPDYTGSWHTLDGEYFLSAWINKSASGKMYMSVKMGNKKEQQNVAPPVAQPAQAAKTDFDQDIPF